MSGAIVGLTSALFWAMGSVLITVGAKRIRVLPLNLVRCLVATTFFWILLPFFGGLDAVLAVPLSQWFLLALSVLMLLVIGDTLFFRSLDLAGVSWAMPVAGIAPFWVVWLATLFLDEPLSWSLLAGALLVVAGIGLVSRTTEQARTNGHVDSRARRTGLILALLVSVLWAVGNISLKPGTEGMNAVVANSIRQPLGALILLIVTLARGQWRDLRGLERRSWGLILLASFLASGFASLFFILTIQLAGAGRAAVLTGTAPLMAIPFSMMWLHERPTRWTLAGTILTTAGIGLVA